ncbi:hypothetical protein H3S74_01485 [Gilliamella sp. W8126]|uniref:hypothetical protein n=1 Tax=Gilliamella sp. W8126 TaxID=2750946 RepID=UPI0018DCDBCF|nr:hypothetical protein [Gilliamella sp. W8126]MBI0004909.1 hypothetical protein [Gilliamella sp. W8126]
MCLKPTFLTILAISSLLILSINSAYALNASTANAIHGNGPYLSFDGINRASTAEPLLWLRLSNGTVYEPYQDRSSSNNPIALPESITKVKDIQTIIPFNNYPSISLSSVIASNNYFNDIDGDIGISSSGTLNVKWSDVNNNDITNWVKNNQDASLSTTDSPYKVTISSTSGRLSTRYGLPQSSDISNFQGASHTYYILPASQARALRTQGLNGGHSFDVTSDINKNFPTTGGDGLSYYLYLSDISSEEVIAVNGTNVNAVKGEGVYLTLSPERKFVVKITLNGPKVQEKLIVVNGKPVTVITTVDKKFTWSTFVLYADRNHSKVLYQFRINKWFIRHGVGSIVNNGNRIISSPSMENCRKLPKEPDIYITPDPRHLSKYRSKGQFFEGEKVSLNTLFGEWGEYIGLWNVENKVQSSAETVYKGVLGVSAIGTYSIICITGSPK